MKTAGFWENLENTWFSNSSLSSLNSWTANKLLFEACVWLNSTKIDDKTEMMPTRSMFSTTFLLVAPHGVIWSFNVSVASHCDDGWL